MLNLTLLVFIIILIIYMCLYYDNINNMIIEGFEEENNEGLNKCDGIVYINLENREDRKKIFLEEVKKINLDENKLHKVSGVYIPKNGHKGCVQSHILALRIAKMNDWNTTCIMEDDIELVNNPEDFNEKVNRIFNELKEKSIEWDVIMLSYANESIDNNEKYETINKIKFGTTSTCYIVKKEYIEKLIMLFEHCQSMMSNDKWGEDDGHESYALDQKWNELIKQDNWYCSKSKLINQRNIKSSINSRE
jgi:hypothetical protein